MTAYHIASGFATAMVFSLALVPFLLKLAIAYGFYDLPDASGGAVSGTGAGKIARKVHSQPIPRIGGVAIVLSFFFTGLVWSFDSSLRAPLLASVGIFFLGLSDDIVSLNAKLRLLIQAVLASAAVYWGGLILREIALTPQLYFEIPPAIGFLLSVFIIVGAINSINMVDGLDGLAGGVVLIGIALLSFTHFVRTKDLNIIVSVSIPVMGAILGFLRYNTHPAKIFMGDSGSNWLGFMLGVLILVVLGTPASAPDEAQHVPMISAVLCLAIAVFDTACVMLFRMRNGQSLMSADKRHFHHTLLSLGLSHSQSVSAVYFLSLAAGILGIIPVIFTQYQFAWLPYVVAVALLLVIPLSVNAREETINRLVRHRIFLREHAAFGYRINRWIRHWEDLNRYTLYFILLASPVLAGAMRPQVGYAAAVAALLIVIVSISRQHQNDFFESLSISAGAIVLLVANNINPIMIEFAGQRMSIQHIYNGLFLFLFASTLLLLFVTFKKRYFVFTPSDFLLVTIPLIMLVAPETYRTEYRLDIICLRSLVVFMCVRTMVKRRRQSLYNIKAVTLFALVVVMLTGIWGMRLVY